MVEVNVWRSFFRSFCGHGPELKSLRSSSSIFEIQLNNSRNLIKSLNKSILDKNLELNKLERDLAQYVDSAVVPKTKGSLSIRQMKSIFKPLSGQVFLSDLKYKLVELNSMKIFLKKDSTDKRKYVSEYFDCDDFSYRLMGQASTPAWAEIAFGIAWSEQHAFNVFVDSKKDVYVIEPQDDRITPLDVIKKNSFYYPFKVVVV